MKFDYIYSEAVDLITARKDDGTKFFSRDSVCVAVTEEGRLFSSFNETSYQDGRLISGSSEKAVFRQMKAAGEEKIAAMITMNCTDMIPVLPDAGCIEELIGLHKYNASTDIISPNCKYIKAKDIADYDPEGDNSGIEILSVDTEARRSEAEKKLDFRPDFNQVTDEGEGKSETKFLFAMPGRDRKPPEVPGQMMPGQMPQQIYTFEDVVHQYQPVDGRNPMGMSRQQSSMYVSQNGSYNMTQSQLMRQAYLQQQSYIQQGGLQQGGLNQPPYMQQGGMPPMYMQQGGMYPPYMQQGGMYPPQYMQQGGMYPPPYMQQNGMNPQFSQQDQNAGQETQPENPAPEGREQQDGGNSPQYTQQTGLPPVYMHANGMNQMYMNPNGMNQMYMNPNGMPPMYMQQGGMNQMYMNPNGMNQMYMNPNGMNPVYMQQGENNPYMQNVQPYEQRGGMASLYLHGMPQQPQNENQPAPETQAENRPQTIDEAMKNNLPRTDSSENVSFDKEKLNALLED